MMDLENHPCFNHKARLKNGRVPLPVAPRCNIQCNFCSRKYDCVNESRPGVTSQILEPGMALSFLRQIMKKREDISVVGIAGPGDPFANPDETIETLTLVRAVYPNILLCVASNGLNILPYISALKKIDLSHVTITVNAVDAKIGSRIYGWVRSDKHVYHGIDGAQILLDHQLHAIEELKNAGLTVKVNTVVIPGINDEHIESIAQTMKELKVDILNCIPFYPVEGSLFARLKEPDPGTITRIRQTAGRYLPQMDYCTRCRADAVGLLGEKDILGPGKLTEEENPPMPATVINLSSSRPYLAVTSREGVLVNQHLGEADRVFIYDLQPDGQASLVAVRPTPVRGGGDQRWMQLSELISDCHTLLVNGIGPNPRRILGENGLRILEVEGLISDIASAIGQGQSLHHFLKRQPQACGSECSGTGGGCG